MSPKAAKLLGVLKTPPPVSNRVKYFHVLDYFHHCFSPENKAQIQRGWGGIRQGPAKSPSLKICLWIIIDSEARCFIILLKIRGGVSSCGEVKTA